MSEQVDGSLSGLANTRVSQLDALHDRTLLATYESFYGSFHACVDVLNHVTMFHNTLYSSLTFEAVLIWDSTT